MFIEEQIGQVSEAWIIYFYQSNPKKKKKKKKCVLDAGLAEANSRRIRRWTWVVYSQSLGESWMQPEETSGAQVLTNKVDVAGDGHHLRDACILATILHGALDFLLHHRSQAVDDLFPVCLNDQVSH